MDTVERPQPPAVEIEHEIDGEVLGFATEAGADHYALTGDETLVVTRTPHP